MNVNKETLLTNSLLIESKLNDFLSTVKDGMYKVECFYQVAAGRGFKKDQLMLTVYKVGHWGVNINFNTETMAIANNEKTIGKFDKETTRDMLNDASWVYMMKLEEVLKGIVSELTSVTEVVEETPVNNVTNDNITVETPVTEESIQVIVSTPVQSYTAFNRSFSSYDAASTYCNDSDFDPSYIETVEPSTVSQHPLTLDLQIFSNEDTKESFTVSNVNIDSHGVWHKGIGKHLELIYTIETTQTDPNIDEINYSNIHEYKCYSVNECLKWFNIMQRQGWFNIQIMTQVNYKSNPIIEDNSEGQLEFNINNSIMDSMKKENKRITQLENELSLYQEFIAKYNSEKLFQSFVDEKENKIQAS